MASTESFVINAIDYRIDLFYNGVAVFQSDHFYFLFYFSISWSKMTILIEINNGLPIHVHVPLVWYLLSFYFLEY